MSSGAKKRIGRPPLAEGKAKDSILLVRLTRADREAVEFAARAAGVTASEWARRLIVGVARPSDEAQ